MRRISIGDQIDFSCGLPEQALYELDEHHGIKLYFEAHETSD